MMSFLNAWALLGVLAVSVPILIHFLKFRQLVQDVPSILLFTSFKRRPRSRKLHEILLLSLRVLFVLALSLLLARPFVKSSSSLPRSGDSCQALLALVIDDGASSAIPVAGKEAFELLKERAVSQIKRLSPESMVLLASSCGKVCSPPLSPQEAASIVERLELQPVQGDLKGAIASAWASLKDGGRFRHGAILVEALPLEELWRGFDPRSLGIPGGMLSVDFPESFPARLDPWIESASLDVQAKRLRVRLDGPPDAVAGCQLELLSGKEGSSAKRFLPGPRELVKREVLIAGDSVDSAEGLSVGLLRDGRPLKSPLAFWHVGSPGSEPSDLIVLLHDGSSSVQEALVLNSALRAVMKDPEANLKAVNVKTGLAQLKSMPRPAAIAIPSLDALPPELAKWIGASFSSGSNVLAFPSRSGALSVPGLEASWRPQAFLSPPQPLALPEGSSPARDFLMLYGKGLFSASLASLRPVEAAPGDEPLLNCGPYPAAVARKLRNGGCAVICGVSPGRDALPLLANPVFPKLVQLLCLYGRGSGLSAGPLLCGEMSDASLASGSRSGAATLIHPDGFKEELVWSPLRRASFHAAAPGLYRLSSGEPLRLQVLAANLRRPSCSPLDAFAFERLCGFRPQAPDSGGVLLSPLGQDGDGGRAVAKLDLTRALAVFMTLLLAFETVFGALRSSRRGAA